MSSTTLGATYLAGNSGGKHLGLYKASTGTQEAIKYTTASEVQRQVLLSRTGPSHVIGNTCIHRRWGKMDFYVDCLCPSEKHLNKCWRVIENHVDIMYDRKHVCSGETRRETNFLNRLHLNKCQRVIVNCVDITQDRKHVYPWETGGRQTFK